MRAAVILVGDELLAGHTRDANGHWLAQRLTALGHRLRRIAIVPDEIAHIHAELDATLPIADIVFLCGGLGPTHDDRTTDALCQRFNRKPVPDEASWNKLQARYAGRPWVTPEVAEMSRKMVAIPEGAIVLDNPVGAAPGYILHEGHVPLVVMPGVPAEMQAIFEGAITGKLLPTGLAATLIEVDLEMPEAAFAKPLGEVAHRFADVEMGSYPHFGEKRVTLRFRGDASRASAALEAFYAACPAAREKTLRRP